MGRGVRILRDGYESKTSSRRAVNPFVKARRTILGLLLVLCLVPTRVLLPPPITVAEDQEELYYDDGVAEGILSPTVVGLQGGVKFSIPMGWTGAKILTARYYIANHPESFKVFVYGGDGETELITPFTVTPTTSGWFDVDLAGLDVIVSGNFFLVIEWLAIGDPRVGRDTSSPNWRTYLRASASETWVHITTYDLMIRAVVETSELPVLSAWASTTPLIDGEITWERETFLPPTSFKGDRSRSIKVPGEWARAAKVEFTLTRPGWSVPATLYVMNDAINLYLAVEIGDDQLDIGEALFVNFDNDNDGVKEAGDNQLRIAWLGDLMGASFYGDGFFQGDGSALLDWEDAPFAGRNDGVGVVQSKSTGSCHFEAAFPLNTNDDPHDFGLAVGSTVGFNLVYYSFESGAGYTGWPTPSFDYWGAMGKILIAESPIQQPPSNVDLSIQMVEVTQAVQGLYNYLPLVYGKPTIARVYVSVGPAADRVDATVFLYGFTPSSFFLGVLTQSFRAPVNQQPGWIHRSANFELPTEWITLRAGGPEKQLVLKAFVKAESSAQSETNHDNNWHQEPYLSFKTTRTLDIHIIPIYVTWATPHLPNAVELTMQEEYFKALFPVASVNFIRHSWRTIGFWSGRSIHELVAALNAITGLFNIEFPDQLFGALSYNASLGMSDAPGCSDPFWIGGSSVASAGGWAGSSWEGVMTHEIIHNLGPGEGGAGWGRHTFDDLNWPYPNDNVNSYGMITRWWGSLQILETIWPTKPEIMSYSTDVWRPIKWISPYRWDHLFDFLCTVYSSAAEKPTLDAVASSMDDCLQISGWISQNMSGALDSVFRLPASPVQPQLEGICSLEFQDAVGSTLLYKTFEPAFVSADGDPRDPYYFAMFLPYQNGTEQVVLRWNNTVLDTVQMSLNPPSVTVFSPNGGEEWDSSLQTIGWAASDFDGDPLSYRLFYSADAGVTWTPISPAIAHAGGNTSYQIDPSILQGGNTSLVRVVASDGFNTDYDQSDNIFTVADKPPTAEIINPANESYFLMNDVILLRGRGFDVDDLTLPDSAYNWTSDIDGYLGNGSIATTMLTPGIHEVRLTITDSQGNTAQDTAIITVTLSIEVTDVSPSKTIVGQGLSMSVNVTVMNMGLTTQVFNATAVVSNATLIAELDWPATNVTLPPGNETTLTFTWDTTGFAKGNYTAGIAVTLQAYAIAGFNETIAVAMIGDITGDGGWPDGKVDIKDIETLAMLFGVTYLDSRYNANYDILYDRIIDIMDIAVAAKRFSTVDP